MSPVITPEIDETLSWDEIEEKEYGEFPVLPRGDYPAMLADYESREAGEKAKFPGAIYYSLQWKAQPEPTDEEPEPTPVTVFHSIYLSPKSVGQTKGVLRMLGADFEGRTIADIEDMLEEVKGNQVMLRVKVRSYKDKDGNVRQTNDVSRVMPLTAVGDEED